MTWRGVLGVAHQEDPLGGGGVRQVRLPARRVRFENIGLTDQPTSDRPTVRTRVPLYIAMPPYRLQTLV
jgi:hypothetical protein